MDKTHHPTWWTDHETSTWDRVKEALRRDWDQTRHDLGIGSTHDLRQDVGDTVKQALGAEAIPPRDAPNPTPTWGDEAAVRYGYGAGVSLLYNEHRDWDRALEEKLARDWATMSPGSAWSDAREAARYGWTRSRDGGDPKP